MKTVAISPFHHARVPAQMINDVKKPRALQILNHLLTLCNPQKPEVWIDQSQLGKKIGIHQDTAGRWVRYLEKIGQIAFIGYRKDGRRKRYRINLERQESQILPKNSKTLSTHQSSKIVGEPPMDKTDEGRTKDRTINKEEETNKKEQTVVDLSKKEFSSNEKIAIKQKLKAIGVFKQSIERLIAQHSIEQIELQLKHMQYQIDRGSRIEKSASWLIRALEGQYALPEAIDPRALQERQKEDAARKASIAAQDAKFALDQGKLDDAKDFATKSLHLAKNTLAETVLRETQELLSKTERIKKVRAHTSQAILTAMHAEEEQKELIKMRRWGKKDAEILASSFFKNLVTAMVDHRLLATG